MVFYRQSPGSPCICIFMVLVVPQYYFKLVLKRKWPLSQEPPNFNQWWVQYNILLSMRMLNSTSTWPSTCLIRPLTTHVYLNLHLTPFSRNILLPEFEDVIKLYTNFINQTIIPLFTYMTDTNSATSQLQFHTFRQNTINRYTYLSCQYSWWNIILCIHSSTSFFVQDVFVDWFKLSTRKCQPKTPTMIIAFVGNAFYITMMKLNTVSCTTCCLSKQMNVNHNDVDNFCNALNWIGETSWSSRVSGRKVYLLMVGYADF